MNCDEFQSSLEEQFEPGASGDSDELRAHRSECEACRLIWDQLRLLDDAIVLWRDATPDCDLTAAVVASLSVDCGRADGIPAAGVGLRGNQLKPLIVSHSDHTVADATPGKTIRSRMWMTLLAGLAAAIVVSMILPLFRTGGPRDPEKIVQQPPERVVPKAVSSSLALASPSKAELGTAVEGVEVRALVEEAGMAYLELAESTASVFRDAAELLPPAVAPRVDVELPSNDDSAGTEWMGGLGDGLKPIGESVSQAFDFLWRAETERAEG